MICMLLLTGGALSFRARLSGARTHARDGPEAGGVKLYIRRIYTDIYVYTYIYIYIYRERERDVYMCISEYNIMVNSTRKHIISDPRFS